MQRYNNAANMSFDDAGGYFQENNNNNNNNNSNFEEADQQGGRNSSSFASLDPSAGFPGLGELPSGGMQESAGVENNLSGTFTGDLNASSYDHVVTGEDHTQLLHDMLQQQSSHANNQSGQSTQPSQVSSLHLQLNEQVMRTVKMNLNWHVPFCDVPISSDNFQGITTTRMIKKGYLISATSPSLHYLDFMVLRLNCCLSENHDIAQPQ